MIFIYLRQQITYFAKKHENVKINFIKFTNVYEVSFRANADVSNYQTAFISKIMRLIKFRSTSAHSVHYTH